MHNKIDLEGKSYKELDYVNPMPVNKMRELFDGYWVFVVNAEFSTGRRLKKGIPAVIGNAAYAGASDGIYEKYKQEKYGEHKELILLKTQIIFSLAPAGGVNA